MLNLGPPSDKEQRLLPLALLKAADEDEIHGITRFQKLVFILQMGDLIDEEEINQEKEYEYEPHNYGPYSKDLHDWLDRLNRKGIIRKTSTKTDAGNDKEIFTIQEEALRGSDLDTSDLSDDLQERVNKTVDNFNQMSILDLLDQVYDEYPDYAVNSKL